MKTHWEQVFLCFIKTEQVFWAERPPHGEYSAFILELRFFLSKLYLKGIGFNLELSTENLKLSETVICPCVKTHCGFYHTVENPYYFQRYHFPLRFQIPWPVDLKDYRPIHADCFMRK